MWLTASVRKSDGGACGQGSSHRAARWGACVRSRKLHVFGPCAWVFRSRFRIDIMGVVRSDVVFRSRFKVTCWHQGHIAQDWCCSADASIHRHSWVAFRGYQRLSHTIRCCIFGGLASECASLGQVWYDIQHQHDVRPVGPFRPSFGQIPTPNGQCRLRAARRSHGADIGSAPLGPQLDYVCIWFWPPTTNPTSGAHPQR